MEKKEIQIQTVIIGGGFAGLFLADNFIKSGYNSFLLVERHKDSMGGFAAYGGIKIGLLPAGEKTKKILHITDYEHYESQFLNNYGEYLIKPQTKKVSIDCKSNNLINKYYYSYILLKDKAHSIIGELFNRISSNVLFSVICGIARNENNDAYTLFSENNTIITCKNIIIASGRNYHITNALKGIGQDYIHRHSLLLGCRVTFDSPSVEHLYRYQPDFKVKDRNKCQTYCFNYRGSLESYFYNNYKIFAGYFDEKSNVGNCFIGCRKILSPDKILEQIGPPIRIDYENLKKRLWPTKLRKEYENIVNFIDNFTNAFGVKIKDLYFPALEQFWAKPRLRNRTLESSSLPNIYYVGDSSGLAFGFLQCYVTSNILAKRLKEAGCIS